MKARASLSILLDDRRAQRHHLLLLACFALASLGVTMAAPFVPLRARELGVGDLSEVARLSGLLVGGQQLITAGLVAFWSSLAQRYGYRLQILRAHVGTCIAMAAYGLARNPLELIGAGVLLGTFGGQYPHYVALAAARAPAAQVGRAVGDMQAAGQVGGMVGPVVGGLLASQAGLTASFLASSLAALGMAALVYTTVRADQPSAVEQGRARGGLRDAFARPEQRRMMLLLLTGDTAIQGLRPLLPVVIAARAEDPAAVAATAGLAVTLVSAGGVATALLVGRVSQRVEPRRILLVAMPVAAALVAALPLATELPVLIGLWVATAFAAGASTPSVFAWLGRLGVQGGGGFALLAGTNMLAFAIGPMVMGQLTTFGLDVPFRLAAVATLAGWVLVLPAAGSSTETRPAA